MRVPVRGPLSISRAAAPNYHRKDQFRATVRVSAQPRVWVHTMVAHRDHAAEAITSRIATRQPRASGPHAAGTFIPARSASPPGKWRAGSDARGSGARLHRRAAAGDANAAGRALGLPEVGPADNLRRVFRVEECALRVISGQAPDQCDGNPARAASREAGGAAPGAGNLRWRRRRRCGRRR